MTPHPKNTTAHSRTTSSLELLENRIAPSTVVVPVYGSPASLPVGKVQPGQVVHFKVLTFSTTDPDDPSEGENVVFSSDQNPHPLMTYTPGQTGEFDYTVQFKNETFSVVITGGDGDENATVQVSAPGVDLSAKIDSAKIVPTHATDLHLLSVFAQEHLNVPVKITNEGNDEARGAVKVQLYLATDPDLTVGKPVLFATKTVTVDLKSNASMDVLVTNAAVPTTLKTGTKYYVVAKITAPAIKENDVVNGQDENNTSASSDQFEDLGPAKYISDTATSDYYKSVRHTLNGTAPAYPVPAGTSVNPADVQSFIAAFEGSRVSPYLDSASPPIPTIGIGLNLHALSASLRTELVNDVRSYYTANYPKVTLPPTEAGVIAFLEKESRPAFAAVQAPAALTGAEVTQLFQDALPKYVGIAQDALGIGVYNSLTAREQVAAVDLAFNTGTIYSSIADGLIAGDFVRAGFQLVNKLRTTQAHTGSPGLAVRIEAEYQNFLAAHLAMLGNIVS